MKLTKRGDKPAAKEYTPVNLTQSQKELYSIQMDVPVPYGKWKGKTGAWIAANDEKYWKWIKDNDIMYSWNMIVLKSEAMRPKTDKPRWQVFISHLGEQWCTIRVVEEKTQPCPIDWYEEC